VVNSGCGAFFARVRALAVNPDAAFPAIKAAVRSYRTSEASARDLVSTIWNVLDQNIDDTASIVNALVDIFDVESKKTGLLSSWNEFEMEVNHRQIVIHTNALAEFIDHSNAGNSRNSRPQA
jgi:hypothetical protein